MALQFSQLLLLVACCAYWLLIIPAKQVSYEDFKTDDGIPFKSFFRVQPSVAKWDTIDTPKKISLTTMVVDHSTDGGWFMKHLHERHSIGWNRTFLNRQYSTRPVACSIRFFGVGLESTLADYVGGGTGYLLLGFQNENKRKFWHGFDRNETNRLHCYYMTGKDYGSEFLDTPKSLGIVINCPLMMDDEVGPFHFTSHMQQGYYCRPLSEYSAMVEVHLRPTSYAYSYEEFPSGKPKLPAGKEAEQEVVGEVLSNPVEVRDMQRKALIRTDYRPHAVCTVQTFKNQFSGAMLFMFVKYYRMMGWRVIVYDRFGNHHDVLKPLLKLPGVDYYPFTLYQLAQPNKYNKAYAKEQGAELKSFYKMEVNWGYSSKKLADTADQDADKSRTYDYARLEYRHLDMILYIDADELFFCPQAAESPLVQKEYQHNLMSQFHSRGVEEMRFVRIPYSGLAPADFINSAENRSNADFTIHTGECMNAALAEGSLLKLAKCWSIGTSYDNFPKSADFASKCPFHYNHWSCDGMKGGGRDWTKNRCRCKVSFEMQNFFEYRPVLRRCHLMHLNDNKYRFQSKRTKHAYDKGDVTKVNPLYTLLARKAL